MSFACGGATKIMNVQALCENPKRDIPKAWLISQLVVVVIYALLGYVASGVAPYDQVANQNLGAIGGMFMPCCCYRFLRSRRRAAVHLHLAAQLYSRYSPHRYGYG